MKGVWENDVDIVKYNVFKGVEHEYEFSTCLKLRKKSYFFITMKNIVTFGHKIYKIATKNWANRKVIKQKQLLKFLYKAYFELRYVLFLLKGIWGYFFPEKTHFLNIVMPFFMFY